MSVDVTTPDGLLERATQLSAMHEALAATRARRRGVLVLLRGEAGAGKTALLRRFVTEVRGVLWGACDPLFTPRPLGPIADIALDVGGELLDLLESGAKPYHLAAAIVREAHARPPGTVIVLEDLHWADEATLDVLSLIGRRMESIPALVIATYRDDELDRAHPLRRMLGELRRTDSIRRLTVEPLSIDAVSALAKPYALDGVALHRATAGNPFFVSEVLAARSDVPAGEIPSTIRDAVLARTGRLGAAATTVIEAVSIARPLAELWLVDALVPDGADALDQCLTSGMLEVVPGGVAFRHELARLTIEESLSPHRRICLHRAALQALREHHADLARLAHHAEAADDADAVGAFAPAAAERAALIGAQREAAAQYARALRFGDTMPADAKAALYEAQSYACYLTDQMEEAIEALQRAIALRREIGDRLGEGAALAALARRFYCNGRVDDATRIAQEAIQVLESLPPGPELALAYGAHSQDLMNDERFDGTITWANRALDIAEQIGDASVIAHNLNNIGTAQLLAGLPEGMENLERSLAVAEQAGLADHVGRVFINVGLGITRTRAYEFAPWFDRGIAVCEDLGLEVWKFYVIVFRARFHLDQGRWSEAADDAAYVLRAARSAPHLHIFANCVLGLLRARRGDPEAWLALDQALALSKDQRELQYLAPVAAARAEAAWLEGRGVLVEDGTAEALDLAVDRRAPWVVGELNWLRHLAGATQTRGEMIEPYALQLVGDGRAAADRWAQLGCPYDAALALVESDDEDDLRFALAEFQRLGARPAAAIVARRLRESGVRGLPRGPRPTTQDNPASLTRREIEVLALVRDGSSNAEIATRLFLSEKTVHHHVSAILRKLGVSSRGQAVSESARLGLEKMGIDPAQSR